MLKCRKCAGHDIDVAVRGHARTCPYRLCSCSKCIKVVNKRLSSVKRRYKNSNVVFVNVECNSGNVRVQAIPKDAVDSLNNKDLQTLQKSLNPSPPASNNFEAALKTPLPESVVAEAFSNYLPYPTIEQQINFFATIASLLKTMNYHNSSQNQS